MHEKRSRYYGRALPVALALGALCSAHANAAKLLVCMMLTSLTTLAAPEMLRRSAARTLSPHKLMGSLVLGALITLLGAGLTQLAAPWLAGWLDAGTAEMRFWLATAGVVTMTQLHSEYLFATGETAMAKLGDLLAALGLLVSLLLSQTLGYPPHQSALTATAVFLVVAIFESARSYAAPEFSPAMLRELPAALLRTLIFPVLGCGLLALTNRPDHAALTALLGGWALFHRCRTTLRRDDHEAASFNVKAALLAICAGIIPLVDVFANNSTISMIFVVMLHLATGLGMVLFGPADSIIGGCTLVLGAVLAALVQRFGHLIFSSHAAMIAAAALLAAMPLAALFAVHASFSDLRSHARARRIRRRAMRNSRR